MILRVVPLGRYRAGGRHVPGVDDIGRDEALVLLLPTTALGALATALGRRQGWTAAEALGCRAVWGPLVEVRGEPHFAAGEYLFPWGELERYLDCARESAEGGASRRCRDPPRPAYRFVGKERPGVHLVGKAVQRLYYARFFWVEPVGGGPPVEVGQLAFLYRLDCDVEPGVWLARVGGEGRLARLEVAEGDVEAKQCGEGVLLSPLLFHAEGPYAVAGRDRGLEAVERVYGVLECGRGEGGGWGCGAKVRSGYFGLGYSLAANVRRPVMQGLPPGTALRLGKPATHAGLFAGWGFGSLACPSEEGRGASRA